MILFADASALVAILTGEEGADHLADRLEAADRRLCSPVSVWETLAALRRSHDVPVPQARGRIGRFMAEIELDMISIGPREYELAVDAYDRFGKGRHPAALNLGDCFAYACAKAHGAALLYVGADFTQTDLA
jgi:ribonuclease VapC